MNNTQAVYYVTMMEQERDKLTMKSHQNETEQGYPAITKKNPKYPCFFNYLTWYFLK